MRIGAAFTGAVVLMAAAIGGASAFNGGSSIGGGTPDAQNGAQGRNYPTSNQGLAFVPAHEGYGYEGYRYAQQPRYDGQGPGYGYVRQSPYPYGR